MPIGITFAVLAVLLAITIACFAPDDDDDDDNFPRFNLDDYRIN